jgi:hypothetical protein
VQFCDLFFALKKQKYFSLLGEERFAKLSQHCFIKSKKLLAERLTAFYISAVLKNIAIGYFTP